MEPRAGSPAVRGAEGAEEETHAEAHRTFGSRRRGREEGRRGSRRGAENAEGRGGLGFALFEGRCAIYGVVRCNGTLWFLVAATFAPPFVLIFP